jgi:hypothetical protein
MRIFENKDYQALFHHGKRDHDPFLMKLHHDGSPEIIGARPFMSQFTFRNMPAFQAPTDRPEKD